MITPPAGARILLATKPVVFRKEAHGLAALAAEVLGENPFSGVVVVFRSKRADRIKILVWDGSGLCLISGLTLPHVGGSECETRAWWCRGTPLAGATCPRIRSALTRPAAMPTRWISLRS
jgi:transposase